MAKKEETYSETVDGSVNFIAKALLWLIFGVPIVWFIVSALANWLG